MSGEKKATAMELAYNLILQKILRERMRPGTPLREEHLAEEFGISSTPVREAFRRLEHDGWVRSIPYRGTCLRTFSPEEIEDMYLLREAIEGIAAGRAVERAEPEDLRQLERAVAEEARHAAAVRDGRTPCPSEDSDLDFHRAIVAAAHSKLLLERNAALRAQFSLISLGAALPASPEEIEAVCEEHRMIFEAICRGWGHVAEELLRCHIANARRKHLALLGADKVISASDAKRGSRGVTAAPKPEPPGGPIRR